MHTDIAQSIIALNSAFDSIIITKDGIKLGAGDNLCALHNSGLT